MQTLRHMTLLARLALAGFLLSLGAAMAAPAVKPQPLEMVCAGGVFKLVAPEGKAAMAPSALDCPWCAPSGLPPLLPVALVVPDWGSQRSPLGAHTPRITAPAAWSPPARAPPPAAFA